MARFSNNKDLNDLAIKCTEEGWTVVHTKKGHLKWTPPQGKGVSFYSGTTPSTPRAVEHVTLQIRRAQSGVAHFLPKEKQQAALSKLGEFFKKPPTAAIPPVKNTFVPKEETPVKKLTKPPVKVATKGFPMRAAAGLVKELMQQQKMDRLSAVDQVYREKSPIITPFGKPISIEGLGNLVLQQLGMGKKRKDSVPKIKKAKIVPTAQIPEFSKPGTPSGLELQIAAHLGSVLSLPFDKEKKMSLMIDILDKMVP